MGSGVQDLDTAGVGGPAASDESSEQLGEDGGRLCGYRGCRAALPHISGPGNRARYCQDDKRWGSKALTCKQAAAAMENVASLGGPTALADPSVTALGEHLDRALPSVAQLADLLVAVRSELDNAVTAAQRERDTALGRAADADGRAEIAAARTATAEERAEEADEAAAAAFRLRAAADTDRDRALDAQRRAERAQAVAEARLTDAQDSATRAERRAGAAAERTEHLEHQLAGARAELLSTQTALEEERQRCNAETHRANQAITDAATEREALRRAFDDRTEQLRTEHERHLQDVRAAHAGELAAASQAGEQAAAHLRDQAEQVRRAGAEQHMEQTVALHQRIGALTAQLRGVRQTLANRVEPDKLRERLATLLAADEDAPVGRE
jgi:chromosome segregation ATPase